MMLGQLDRHIKKNEVGPLPYTTRKKNELKMDHRPKCKLLKVNTGVNLHDPGLGQVFLDTTSEAQVTNKNTNYTTSK